MEGKRESMAFLRVEGGWAGTGTTRHRSHGDRGVVLPVHAKMRRGERRGMERDKVKRGRPGAAVEGPALVSGLRRQEVIQRGGQPLGLAGGRSAVRSIQRTGPTRIHLGTISIGEGAPPTTATVSPRCRACKGLVKYLPQVDGGTKQIGDH